MTSQENSQPSQGQNQQSSSRKGVSEEAAIVNTFMLVIKNKFIADPSSPSHEGKSKMRRFDEVYLSESYQAEKKQLTKINNHGMTAGIAISVGSFLFFRGGPRMMTRFLNRNRSSGNVPGSGGYQFDINNAASPHQMTRPEAGSRKPGFFLRAVKLGLDLFVSVSLGAWGTAFFTDSKKFMKDLSDIPLVEGRSLVSEELCDDFIDVYKAIPKKTWDKYNDKSVPLGAITNFVQNCLRRQMVEKDILDERKAFGSFGMGSSVKHVDIPSPGVPRDLSVEIPFTDKSEELNTEKSILDVNDPFEESGFDFNSWNDGNDAEQSDANDREWK